MCNRVLLLFGKLLHCNVHVNCHVNWTTFQNGLIFQTALSSLRVSCKRALSKGMSNIYSTVTIEKIWPTQKFELSNFLLQLKNQRFGSKSVCGFSIAFILKGRMTFRSQRVHAFCWKNETESTMENPTHSFGGMKLLLQLV